MSNDTFCVDNNNIKCEYTTPTIIGLMKMKNITFFNAQW